MRAAVDERWRVRRQDRGQHALSILLRRDGFLHLSTSHSCSVLRNPLFEVVVEAGGGLAVAFAEVFGFRTNDGLDAACEGAGDRCRGGASSDVRAQRARTKLRLKKALTDAHWRQLHPQRVAQGVHSGLGS